MERKREDKAETASKKAPQPEKKETPNLSEEDIKMHSPPRTPKLAGVGRDEEIPKPTPNHGGQRKKSKLTGTSEDNNNSAVVSPHTDTNTNNQKEDDTKDPNDQADAEANQDTGAAGTTKANTPATSEQEGDKAKNTKDQEDMQGSEETKEKGKGTNGTNQPPQGQKAEGSAAQDDDTKNAHSDKTKEGDANVQKKTQEDKPSDHPKKDTQTLHFTIELGKRETSDWKKMCPSPGSHNRANLYTRHQPPDTGLAHQLMEALTRISRQIEIAPMLQDPSDAHSFKISSLMQLMRESLRAEKDRTMGIDDDTCQKFRRIITKTAKTPPSYFGNRFKFDETNNNRALLPDELDTRFWTACHICFGNPWRYDRGNSEDTSWKDSIKITVQEPSPSESKAMQARANQGTRGDPNNKDTGSTETNKGTNQGQDQNKTSNDKAATQTNQGNSTIKNPYAKDTRPIVISFLDLKVPAFKPAEGYSRSQIEAMRVKNIMGYIEKAIRSRDRAGRIVEFKTKDQNPEEWSQDQLKKITSFHRGTKFLEGWKHPSGIDQKNGYIRVRMRVSHKCDVEVLVEAMNIYFDNLAAENKPSEVSVSPIQSACIATAGWLLGLHPNWVHRPRCQMALKEILKKEGQPLDVKVAEDDCKLFKHNDPDAKKKRAPHVPCRQAERQKAIKALRKLFAPEQLHAKLPYASKCFFVPDVSGDKDDAQLRGLECVQVLIAHHGSIMMRHVAIEREDFLDLDGARVGGDGPNLREFLMGASIPSQKNPDENIPIFLFIDVWASDNTKVNVAVDRDHQCLAKNLMNALPFAIEKKFGREILEQWITPEAIEWAHDNCTEKDGVLVSELRDHLESLTKSVAKMNPRSHEEETQLMIETETEQLQITAVEEDCLITNLEILDGFPQVKGNGKRTINTASSVAAQSLALSENSVGSNLSLCDTKASGRSNNSLQGNVSLCDSSVGGQSTGVEANLSLCDSSKGSSAADIDAISLGDSTIGTNEPPEDGKEDEDEADDDDEDNKSTESSNKRFREFGMACRCDASLRDGRMNCPHPNKPIVCRCGNTFNCVAGLHHECAIHVKPEGTVFCSRHCKKYVEGHPPSKEDAWAAFSPRDQWQLYEHFLNTSGTADSNELQTVFFHALMIMVKHLGCSADDILGEPFDKDRLFSPALSKCKAGVSEQEKPILRQALNTVWPPEERNGKKNNNASSLNNEAMNGEAGGAF